MSQFSVPLVRLTAKAAVTSSRFNAGCVHEGLAVAASRRLLHQDKTANLAASESDKIKPEANVSEKSSSSRNAKRWLHYNSASTTSSKPTPASIRERNITVSSYYNQTAIDQERDSPRVSRSLERFCYMCPLLFSCFFPKLEGI
jgi:hypothetical protein